MISSQSVDGNYYQNVVSMPVIAQRKVHYTTVNRKRYKLTTNFHTETKMSENMKFRLSCTSKESEEQEKDEFDYSETEINVIEENDSISLSSTTDSNAYNLSKGGRHDSFGTTAAARNQSLQSERSFSNVSPQTPCNKQNDNNFKSYVYQEPQISRVLSEKEKHFIDNYLTNGTAIHIESINNSDSAAEVVDLTSPKKKILEPSKAKMMTVKDRRVNRKGHISGKNIPHMGTDNNGIQSSNVHVYNIQDFIEINSNLCNPAVQTNFTVQDNAENVCSPSLAASDICVPQNIIPFNLISFDSTNLPATESKFSYDNNVIYQPFGQCIDGSTPGTSRIENQPQENNSAKDNCFPGPSGETLTVEIPNIASSESQVTTNRDVVSDNAEIYSPELHSQSIGINFDIPAPFENLFNLSVATVPADEIRELQNFIEENDYAANGYFPIEDVLFESASSSPSESLENNFDENGFLCTPDVNRVPDFIPQLL